MLANSSKLFTRSTSRLLQARISGYQDIQTSSRNSRTNGVLPFYPGLGSSSGRQTLGVSQGNPYFWLWQTRVRNSHGQHRPVLIRALQIKCFTKLLPFSLTSRSMRARTLFQPLRCYAHLYPFADLVILLYPLRLLSYKITTLSSIMRLAVLPCMFHYYYFPPHHDDLPL